MRNYLIDHMMYSYMSGYGVCQNCSLVNKGIMSFLPEVNSCSLYVLYHLFLRYII